MLFSQREALKPRDDTVKKDYRKTRRKKRGGEKKKGGIHEAGTENQAVRWLETQEEMTNCEQMETCHVTVH